MMPQSKLDLGENELDNYMPWDEIPPAIYTKSPAVTNLDNIKKNSEARIKQKEVFKLIEENAVRYKDQKNNTIYPLNIDKFREKSDLINKEAEKFKDIQKDTTGLGVEYIKLDYLMIKSDSAKLDRAEDWHNNLKKDVYLMEAMAVLKDMFISITGRLPEDNYIETK